MMQHDATTFKRKSTKAAAISALPQNFNASSLSSPDIDTGPRDDSRQKRPVRLMASSNALPQWQSMADSRRSKHVQTCANRPCNSHSRKILQMQVRSPVKTWRLRKKQAVVQHISKSYFILPIDLEWQSVIPKWFHHLSSVT